LVSSVAGASTLTGADTLIATAGTNVLNITVDGTATATSNGASISGFQTINVRNAGTGAPAALDASTTPGVTTVNADRGTGAFSVTNLASGAKFGAVGNGVVTLGALGVGYAAAATASTINVSGGTVSTGTITQTGTGLLSTTINSTGAANTVGAIVMAASQTGALTINATSALTTGAITQTGADAATSVIVTGAGAVDISAGALMTTVKTVNLSGNSGGVKVVTGNTAAGTASAAGLTVTGGTGADTIDIRASDAADFVTVNATTGADVVKITNAQIAAAAPNFTVSGNSAATLQIDFADTAATQAASLATAFTGFGTIEVISNNAAGRTETLAMATNALGVSNFVWSGDAGDTFTLTGLAAASTITVKTNIVALNATIGTNTSADVLNVVLDGTTSTGTYTATNYETLNITSQIDTAGNTNVANAITASSATNVVITGSATLNTGTLTTAASGTVNASGMTVATAGTTLTSTLTSATTTFIGGAAKDVLTLAAGTLAQGYSYNGGTGADTIDVATTSAQNAGILALSNFATVTVTTHAAAQDTATFDLRNLSNIGNLVFKAGEATDLIVLNNLKSGQILTLDGTNAFGGVTLNAAAGGTGLQTVAFNDSLTVTSLTADAGTTGITLSEITGKTATISNPIVGGSLTSVTLTGAGSFAIGAQSATVTTINGSALTAGSLTATLGTAGTLTGGAGNDALTGSSGADTIIGGAGNDNIRGNAGADTINVGSGTDNVTYAGNTDTLTGVLATNASLVGADIVTGMGNGDTINLASLANLVLADGAVTVGTSFATATANLVTIVSGSYDTGTKLFTAGVASATNNDYLVQYNGGATTTTVNSFLLVDIVGTVTAASTTEVITLSVA